jgi:hypothetical protein
MLENALKHASTPKYAPERQRGIFSEGRAASYGFKDTTADHAREAGLC